MAGRNRWLIFASLAVLIVIAGAILLFSGGDETGISPVSSGLVADDGTGDESSSADTASTSPSTSALTVTEEQPPPAKPSVKDKPAPPSTPLPAPSQQPSAAWQEYLDGTRETVQDNEVALADAIAAATAAIGSGDADALAAMIAPDEGAQDAYTARLSNTYPDILSSDPGANVNVFTDGQATVYIAYVVVKWQDAGLVSEHTIPIMLRFVGGQWHLTTLGEAGDDLQFVQTVML